jgi:DNA-3-methyladenine glycosylase
MFGPPGVAYVYLVYGMYDCLNIVTEPAGMAAAVLVRAVEPVDGIESMREARLRWLAGRRRGLDASALRLERDRLWRLPSERLASGPGLLSAAFDVDRSMTGTDLCDPGSPLRLEPRPPGAQGPAVVASPRVGVGYAGADWAGRPWRLAIAGSRSLSGPPLRG